MSNPDPRALVVAAGPSLHRRRSLERLRTARFGGLVVAVDGALGACLRHGIVPDVVVSVDPHGERIVRWFGNPTLTAAPADDYFRRQEMDPVQRHDEVAANRELVELVDRYGPRMKVAIATSAAPAVVDRCEKAGMSLYWWNPMYDDYEAPDSVSRRLHGANRLPCLNGGGNVGTAAWVIARAVLGRRRVGIVGMDLSYAPGTPYARTQYYPRAARAPRRALRRGVHPHRQPARRGDVVLRSRVLLVPRRLPGDGARRRVRDVQLHRRRNPVRGRRPRDAARAIPRGESVAHG